MVNGLISSLARSFQSQCATSVRIYIKTRPIAAANVQPDAVTFFEHIGGWVKLEGEFVYPPWCHKFGFIPPVTISGTDNGVSDIKGQPLWIFVSWRININ